MILAIRSCHRFVISWHGHLDPKAPLNFKRWGITPSYPCSLAMCSTLEMHSTRMDIVALFGAAANDSIYFGGMVVL